MFGSATREEPAAGQRDQVKKQKGPPTPRHEKPGSGKTAPPEPAPARPKEPPARPPHRTPPGRPLVVLKIGVLIIVLGLTFAVGILVGLGTVLQRETRRYLQDQTPPSPSPVRAEEEAPSVGPGFLARMPGRKSLIIISNFGPDDRLGPPAAEAAAVKARYGDVSIYTISFAADEEGVRRAKALAQASPCGRYFDGSAALDSGADFQALVKEVLVGSRDDQDQDGVCNDFDKCPDTPSGASVDEHGCPVALTFTLHIQFPTGRADISPQDRDKIGQVARRLQDFPETKATIEGYTDSQGAPERNKQLSQRRAESVRDYLVKEFQIPPDRLKAVGYGQEEPVADNGTPEGRQKNRRVEVIIDKDFKV
ncbi:MAG: OmpA family protein [Thermodesulfobacteriota bacterium]